MIKYFCDLCGQEYQLDKHLGLGGCMEVREGPYCMSVSDTEHGSGKMFCRQCIIKQVTKAFCPDKVSPNQHLSEWARMSVYAEIDRCVDVTTREFLRCLMDGKDYEQPKCLKSEIGVGDVVTGAGYAHDAPGGIVYAMKLDEKGEVEGVHLVTLNGEDGYLAIDCLSVVRRVPWVEGMVVAIIGKDKA